MPNKTIDRYFDKVYYSHRIGFRKPHPESFKKILEENNLIAEETLFVDDSIQHVEGARKAGIHAVHITDKTTISSIPQIIETINVKIRQKAMEHFEDKAKDVGQLTL